MKAKKTIVTTLVVLVGSFWIFIITCRVLAIKGTEERGFYQKMSDLPYIGEELKDFPVIGEIAYFYKTSYMVRFVYFRAKVDGDVIKKFFDERRYWKEAPPEDYSVTTLTQEGCFPIYPSEEDIVFCKLSHPRIYFYYMPSRNELTGYSYINIRN
jgi:hypothetical protein